MWFELFAVVAAVVAGSLAAVTGFGIGSLLTPILGPIRQANALGNASFSRGVPAAISGRTFWFQAMETGRATNWEKRTIL